MSDSDEEWAQPRPDCASKPVTAVPNATKIHCNARKIPELNLGLPSKRQRKVNPEKAAERETRAKWAAHFAKKKKLKQVFLINGEDVARGAPLF